MNRLKLHPLPQTNRQLMKEMFLFFLPILVGTFFQQLYNTVDAVIVGQFVGKEALAAVGGTTGTLINLAVGFFVGLAGGATVIVAQGSGARDARMVERAVHTGMVLAIVGGAGLTVLGLLGSATVLRWMGVPEDVFPMSNTYLMVYFCGMIPNLIYNVGSGILRAVGDSKRPLYYLITACVTNIVLDLILVVGLRMGVLGVSIATVASQAVSAILVVRALCADSGMHHLDLRKLRFDGRMLLRIMSIGIPAGLQSSMYAISNVLVQATVNSFLTDVMASWTAYSKLDSLYWMASGAFGTAVATFSGQAYGAGDLERMKQSLRCGFVMNVAYAVVLSVAIVFGGQYALLLFLTDPVPLAYGIKMCYIMTPFLVTFVPIELMGAQCRSAGDTFLPMVITALGVCGTRIGWIYTVMRRYHMVELLYVCYPVSWIITCAAFILYYYKSGWLDRRLRLDQHAQHLL